MCKRTAVKYGKAINEAVALGAYIKQTADKAGQDHEIELSVDETEQPTTLGEHYIIADQCLQAGMKLVSLAPRFIGDYEKGVDFKGDHDALDISLHDHAAIAQHLGPYKLSLHSGSDKLSMYTLFAKATKGMFHVKTAGTSYLEALRVAAIHDEALFREIVTFSRGRYETDRATYHVSATLDSAPEESGATLDTLVDQYLENWADVPQGIGFTRPGRQILHCTFGSVLTDDTLGTALRKVLDADHLKTPADVDITAAAGFTFFTIDPSDHVDQKADDYDTGTVDTKFAAIADSIEWYGSYAGKTITLPNGTKLELTENVCKRTAVKYGQAINEAIALGAYIKQTADIPGSGPTNHYGL